MKARHPLAAVSAVLGIVVGAVALVGTAATAADGEVTGSTTFTCTVGTFDPYDYDATIVVSATRPTASSDKVSVSATLSDMPGVVPVTLGSTTVTDQLVLNMGGTSLTLKGTGTADLKAGEPFPMPDVSGKLTSSASSLSVQVTSFTYTMPAFSMSGSCTPTAGSDLGTLTIATAGATTSPTATDTSSPSATPTATDTATATATPTSTETTAPEAAPAKGDVDFACTLQPFNSDFAYPATISVSGYRAEEGGPVELTAKMSDLPGIAPVQIDGDMDVTLDAEVGGTAVTLKGTGHAKAAPKAEVTVPKLTGEVEADGDELEVAVTAFTFEFADLGVAADCTSDRTVLGTMVVGTEAPDETDNPDPTDSSSSAPTVAPDTSGTGSLPKTGGTDALPVIVLWAGALSLLGVAGLVAVPAVARRRTH